MGALFAAPFGYLVWQNLALGSDLVGTLFSARTAGPLSRSIILAVAVSLSCAALGTGLAWLTARSDLPLRRLFRVLVPLPLVIPSFVGAAAFVAAFTRGGLFDQVLPGRGNLPQLRGFWAAFFVLTLLSYPYVYLPVAARMAGLPPTLEESARLLGAGPVVTFIRVVVPQSLGAVTAGSLLVFLYVISDFGAVQLLRYDTLTRAIYSSRLFARPTSLALSLILGLLAVSVVAAERVAARKALPVGAPTATRRRPLVVPLRRARMPALVAVSAVVCFALVAPLVVLAHWAFRGLVGGRVGSGAIARDLTLLVRPALNSAWAGVLSAAVAVALVLPVAYLVTRHRSRVAEAANAMVVAGFALPGLVIALALGFWSLHSPAVLGLYQSFPVLILAYVVHFGAQSLRAGQVAVGVVSSRVDDAARLLGASPLRRFLRVDLPLMTPVLLAGAGLVMLSTMKELPATLLLAPIGFRTLATRIWNAAEDGFLADVGLASLLLVALSGVLTWLLVIRRAEHLA